MCSDPSPKHNRLRPASRRLLFGRAPAALNPLRQNRRRRAARLTTLINRQEYPRSLLKPVVLSLSDCDALKLSSSYFRVRPAIPLERHDALSVHSARGSHAVRLRDVRSCFDARGRWLRIYQVESTCTRSSTTGASAIRHRLRSP